MAKMVKRLADELWEGGEMYRHEGEFLRFEEFFVPFGGKLLKNNRWIKMAKMILWNKFEKMYGEKFRNNNRNGRPAFSLRVALGALIIQKKLGLTDRETVSQIQENPYLQYFIGYEEFKFEVPFDASMMVHFRKRLDFENICEINNIMFFEDMVKNTIDSNDDDETGTGNKSDKNNSENVKPNSGILMADATCAPVDMKYPTDIDLLSEGREKSETIIDTLFKPLVGNQTKPRTYRKKAKREAANILKNPNKRRGKNLHRNIRKQLGYLGRNLKHIDKLIEKTPIEVLSKKQQNDLWVIRELYQQQKYMFDNKTKVVKNRIVSISRYYVRPIKRGKASAPVEFGPKITVGLVNGYAHIFNLNWNNINEGTLLIPMIKDYYKKFGFYPEAVLVDKLFRTKRNINFCEKYNIRISGIPLGKPKKITKTNEQMKIEIQDEKDRNAIEGIFGVAKRRFNLNLIMSKLQPTSETAVALSILLVNLEKRMRSIFVRFIFTPLFQAFSKLFNTINNMLLIYGDA